MKTTLKVGDKVLLKDSPENKVMVLVGITSTNDCLIVDLESKNIIKKPIKVSQDRLTKI